MVLQPDGQQVDELAAALGEVGDFSLIKITPAHLEVLSRMLPGEAAARLSRALIIGGEAQTYKYDIGLVNGGILDPRIIIRD